MPWKECHVVDERTRFVTRLMDGEKMTALCAEFGISRKTGYKIVERYQRVGVRGLSDRSRRPYRHANQLPSAVETLIVRLKTDYPTWGAPKIRDRLSKLYPDVHTLAISTVRQAQTRGPVGSGYLAPPVFSAIYIGPAALAAEVGGLPAVFGMTIFAGLVEMARGVKHDLQVAGLRAVYDDTGAIGKLYRRQDEIGTPFCITVDFQSLEDQTVTVRDRDTMGQERVGTGELGGALRAKVG